MKESKVFYICFYCEKEVEEKIVSYPSVLPKIDYIISKLKENGNNVNVVSIAPSKSGKFAGYEKTIDSNEKHTYLSSTSYKSKMLNKFMMLVNSVKIIRFLINNTDKNSKVLVYHSLYNRFWIPIYHKLFKKEFYLEIEDVFSTLDGKERKHNKKEMKIFNMAAGCLCINDLVFRNLHEVKNKVISYGNYALPEVISKPKNEPIKVVYAGVIEQQRNAAFLAVKAALYLPYDYEVHILGFGTDENITALEDLISTINNKLGRTVVKFHGRKTGKEYLSFLQSCHIALSTHVYDDSNMESANNTFPSKTLVYLANGLRVVAQELEVLKSSYIGEWFYYYDTPIPEKVAQAIKSVDINSKYDSRAIVEKLDKKFGSALNDLLG